MAKSPTTISQQLVPIILTIVPSPIPEPTAPRCASNAPTAIGIPSLRPSLVAHSLHSFPASVSTAYASLYRRSLKSPSFGSSFARKSLAGKPPHSLENIALWPAAQTLRLSVNGFVSPAKTAGNQSQYSTQLKAASKTASSTRKQCKSLLKNHSLEYIPPHLARYSGCSFLASSVISLASAKDV